VKVRVSLFIRVPGTADCLNLVSPSDAESAPRHADDGEDALEGGDTAEAVDGVSCYSTSAAIRERTQIGRILRNSCLVSHFQISNSYLLAHSE
jgi:hypothetical protein